MLLRFLFLGVRCEFCVTMLTLLVMLVLRMS